MEKLEKVKYIIIHHTKREKDFPLFTKYRHIYRRGFEDNGYHFMIGNGKFFTKDGKIYKARQEKFWGAHVYGQNHHSIGICMIGDFDKEKPSKKQIESLICLIKKLKEKYNVPIKNIKGHREFPNVTKTCPGKNIDLKKIRNKIKN